MRFEFWNEIKYQILQTGIFLGIVEKEWDEPILEINPFFSNIKASFNKKNIGWNCVCDTTRINKVVIRIFLFQSQTKVSTFY